MFCSLGEGNNIILFQALAIGNIESSAITKLCSLGYTGCIKALMMHCTMADKSFLSNDLRYLYSSAITKLCSLGYTVCIKALMRHSI